MAVGTGIRLEELEYSWFAQKNPAGVATNAPTEDLRRAYYISQVGEQGVHEDLLQLELRWLRSLTGVTSNQHDEAWLQAVAGAGLTPQGSTVANKILYYKTQA